jgi:hypothetical protein
VTEDGKEVLRMAVGTERRPYVFIQDFDGRRLILTAWPYEPALPPSTVWIIDLECGDCTQVFETTGTEYFDLIGTVASEGPVVAPTIP